MTKITARDQSRMRIPTTVLYPMEIISAERQEQNTVKWKLRAANGDEFVEITSLHPNGGNTVHPWVEYVKARNEAKFANAQNPQDVVGGKVRAAIRVNNPSTEEEGPPAEYGIGKVIPFRVPYAGRKK